MDELLLSLKRNLRMETTDTTQDALLIELLQAAISYAEGYQHVEDGYYTEHPMALPTRQAIIMHAVLHHEAPDGASGGYFGGDGTQAWNAIHRALRLDRATPAEV